ncbi:MAG: hypothetical protein L0G54_09175 [Brevibacterium sp.]|nr:hypothetical protein [Brevibacterium sp.]
MTPQPTGTQVSMLLGKGEDTTTVALAEAYVPIIWELARDYTRGVGFSQDGTEAEPVIVSVVKLATARIASNPTQVKRYQIGEYQETPSTFDGFTLAEQTALNTYRRRSA